MDIASKLTSCEEHELGVSRFVCFGGGSVVRCETARSGQGRLGMSDMEARLERLESLLSLQDRTIEKLGDALFEQQQQMLEIEKKLDRLAGKVREMDTLMDQGPSQDAPPPHYGR